MKLNKNLPIPLYHQLKTMIEGKIDSEEWPPGYQLPTEKELVESLQVSRITVKGAIIDLVKEGRLYRQQGKGTFVSAKREEKDIYQLVSFSDGDKGFPHHTLNFVTEPAGVGLSHVMELQDTDLVVKMKRIKVEDSTPVAIEYSYIPHSICPNLTQVMIENDLLYNVMKKEYGVQLKKAKIYLSPSIASEHEASLLKIKKGTSVYTWERKTYSTEEELVEYSKFIIRQDKAKYYLEVSL